MTLIDSSRVPTYITSTIDFLVLDRDKTWVW